jgi:hypothetical protein
MTRSLIDGTDVPLGLLPSGTLFFTFSADAGNIVVQVEAGSGATGAYGASVGVSQSLAFLTSDGAAFVAQGGHVAAITATGAVQVLPISGGAPVVISQTVASGASFENGVANPLLLIWGSGLVVTASDGTGALEQPVPGYLGFALWLGPAVLYGITAIGEPLPTLSVLTGAGKRVTRLAALVGAYAWAPIAVPRRVFWSRAVANAGGLPGLWMVDLPP